MYKIIYNNIVIDIIRELKYLRYLKKTDRTVLTDKSSGFLGRPRYSTMKHMLSTEENFALLV